jgi:hypothetical protein
MIWLPTEVKVCPEQVYVRTPAVSVRGAEQKVVAGEAESLKLIVPDCGSVVPG